MNPMTFSSSTTLQINLISLTVMAHKALRKERSGIFQSEPQTLCPVHNTQENWCYSVGIFPYFLIFCFHICGCCQSQEFPLPWCNRWTRKFAGKKPSVPAVWRLRWAVQTVTSDLPIVHLAVCRDTGTSPFFVQGHIVFTSVWLRLNMWATFSASISP